jgi:tetratricopeptide (TPR) repeat protein
MYERALRGHEKAWGPEHTSTLDTVSNLGILYANQGRLSDAEAMYERALRCHEKAMSHDRVDTYIPALNTIHNFANLRAQRGRVPEARALYLRCQAGLKAVFGVQHDQYRTVTSAQKALDLIEARPATAGHHTERFQDILS